MKDLVKTMVLGFVCMIGACVGQKVWNEVLEDKVDDLKERLVKKE